MRRISATPTVMRAQLTELLDDLVGTVGLSEVFVGAEVHLYTNTPVIEPGNIVGDFTEATFTGYAAVTTVTWSAPGNVSNVGLAVHSQVLFTAGAITPPGETVQGYYLTDSGASNVYAAEQFDDPVPFDEIADFLELDLYFQIPWIWTVTDQG